jgi:hypothetical protein
MVAMIAGAAAIARPPADGNGAWPVSRAGNPASAWTSRVAGALRGSLT